MALTNNINNLSPSNFKISIDTENYKNVVFFAQSYNHPSVSVDAATQTGSRLNIPVAGDKIQYGELSINVVIDEDMTSYIEMLEWLERLVNQKPKSIDDRIKYGDIPTYADITVSILSSKNNSNKQIRYKDCVITSIGDIAFESTSQESAIIFPVTFKFSTFEIL